MENEDPDILQVDIDPNHPPFGVIAGRRMTRIMVHPVSGGMQKLEAIETKDWFPLGLVPIVKDDIGLHQEQWLAFAVAVDDLGWWVEHLSKAPGDGAPISG